MAEHATRTGAALPAPVTTSDFYLAAILVELITIRQTLDSVVELATAEPEPEPEPAPKPKHRDEARRRS